jgi:MFS family permease
MYQKTRRRALAAIFIISSTILLGNVTSSLLAYIMASYPDLEPTTVMQIMTFPGLIGIVVSFAIGPLALRISKKALMIVAVSTLLIYFVVFAFVGGEGPFLVLLVAACLTGICSGSGITLTNSMISDYVIDESKRANYVALSMAIMNGGSALISVSGGFIAAGNGGADWPLAYYCGVIILPALIAFIILMPKKPEAAPMQATANVTSDSSEATAQRIPLKAVAIIIVHAGFFLCYSGFLLNTSSYIIGEYQLGTSVQAGIAISICTLFGVIASIAYPLLSKLWKNWMTVIGYASVAFGLLLMSLVHTTIVGAYAGAALVGVSLCLANPYVMARLMSLSPPRLIPVTMSLLMGGMSIGLFLCPFILNFISSLLGGGAGNALLGGSLIAALCAIAAVFLYLAPRNLSQKSDNNTKSLNDPSIK